MFAQGRLWVINFALPLWIVGRREGMLRRPNHFYVLKNRGRESLTA